MQATIEYLSDPEAIAAVKRGRRDIAAGRVIDEAGIEALRLELEARRDRKTLDASDV
jgi:predicted transcriptional regulator